MLKKTFAIILVVITVVSLCIFPASAEERKLTFDENGKFRILQINDFQDIDTTNTESLKFLNAVLDKYKPDLVVLVGDQIRDGFSGVTVDKIKTALSNQLMPMEERGIPFLFTFGNHDRDYQSLMPMEEQAAYYREFSCCYANTDGADGGTYSTLIYSKDGTAPLLNIYMMDTQHWNGTGWTSGVTEEQVNWYVETSSSLKEANGGKVIPAIVFQHIPVKEIRSFLKEVPAGTEGALRSKFYSDKYYVLDESVTWIGDRNVMRETPASEHPEKITGQYEAWLSQGDVMGAYFGHDHINTFTGVTEDGIALGYNGGFGFATYGDPGERYATVYDFDENNIEGYTEQTVYYTQCVVEEPEPPTTEPPTTEPEAPGTDEENNCSCNCHKTGFMGFIWKILCFFYKLFGSNKICGCGIAHY